MRLRSDVEANEEDEILHMRIKLRIEKYRSNLCKIDTLEEARR